MSDHSDNFLIERANSSALTTFRRAPPEDIPDECKLCGANPHQHCFMSGAFQGCPRDLRRLPVVSVRLGTSERVLT